MDTCPPKATFRHDTDENNNWLGDLSNLFSFATSAGLATGSVAKLESLVSKVTSPRLDSTTDARREMLVMLRSLKRSAEFTLGYQNSAPYISIPEADRSGIRSELAELTEQISGSNQIGDEQKQILLSEIAIFEASIVQPRLSADLISRFVNAVLYGAAMKLVGETAEQIADRLAGALLGYLVSAIAGS